MDIDKARAISADILVKGVMTDHRLPVVREAYDILFLNSLLFKDARPEHGAMLILTNHIDTLTFLTTPITEV